MNLYGIQNDAAGQIEQGPIEGREAADELLRDLREALSTARKEEASRLREEHQERLAGLRQQLAEAKKADEDTTAIQAELDAAESLSPATDSFVHEGEPVKLSVVPFPEEPEVVPPKEVAGAELRAKRQAALDAFADKLLAEQGKK